MASSQGSHHSQTSLSPSTSHTNAAADPSPSTLLPLETLVSHLLASKRSLNSLPLLYRANDLVTSARHLLTSSLIHTSRATFLRHNVSHQTKLLRRVRTGIEAVRDASQRDFQEVIRGLDSADGRLQGTMEVLRGRMVEAGLRPRGEGERSLADFVEEGGVERVRGVLKEEIDRAQEAQAEFLDSIHAYDKDLQAIKAALTPTPSTPSPHDPSPIPPRLAALEEHAAEMASLLDSLVRHFDLCVNALKHTEGGFAAVQRAATNNQLPDGVTVSGVIQEASQDPSAAEEPMSEEERRQMLTVVSNDAAEVEDVVLELQQRLISMEEQHEQIRDHVAALTATYTSTLNAFSALDSLSTRLPLYIAASQTFLSRWAASKALIGEQMEELESMRVFYEGYLSSYHGLLEEVARRKAAEEKMRAVMKKALETVRKLHESDTRERERFRRAVGEWLPSDLWKGLVIDAPRFEVGIVGEEFEDEAEAEAEDAPKGREGK